MKRLLPVAFIAGLCLQLAAQPFGNEWIRYDQQYWAFKVWAEGARRIDSTALADAGLPLASIDPRGFQLYARGRQVPIYVKGEQDGQFNSGDFIEFYAFKNDGWLDSTLWDDPAHINNPYYSLYNDTIRYYLTWGSSSGALRMDTISSSNWAARQPLPWCWGTTLVQDANIYQGGISSYNGAMLCTINEGEGYFSGQPLSTTGGDAVKTYTLNLPGLNTTAGLPPLTYRSVWAGLLNPGFATCPDHHLVLSHAGTTYMDTIFQGRRLLKLEFEFPLSSVGGASTVVNYTAVHDLVCNGLPPDYHDATALAWHSIRYPRDFAFVNGTVAELPAQAGTDSLRMDFSLANDAIIHAWTPGGSLVRCKPVLELGGLHAVLPPAATDMRMAVTRVPLMAPVTAAQLLPVTPTGYFTDPAGNLPDSALVIVTHTTLMDAAQQYALYRQTNPNNRYNTIVADVEDLYHQFGGGVRLHPMAIRNFIRYVYSQAPSRPQGLFLVGKSVKAPATGGLSYQRGYRRDALAAAACLVPTMGWPNSDMSFGLNLTGTQPAYLSVPVGRLAARTPDDVLHYLAKVDSVESQPPAAWMKNILHFRGGFTDLERTMFDNALHSFQVVAEDTSFFGHVTRFVKNGPDIIEQAALDSVTDMVANGVTLMTFFAHAYGGGFDITIDSPSNYNWHGKFPTIFGNSCYTGNLHLYDAASTSEQFVLHENAGAVAFISSSDIGLSTLLAQYCRDFYKSFSQVNYGKSIGQHMRFASFNQLGTGTIDAVNSAETIHLHGDPTLVMNSPKLPDLEVTQADVLTIPQQVTADLDSFRLQVIFRNIGRGTHQSFSVAVDRRLVDLGVDLPTVTRQVQMGSFQDTVVFTLPTQVAAGGVGINDLQVRLDLDPDLIQELDETGNNQVTMRINIRPGDLLPVHPYNFAITPDHAPILKASTGDPFAPPRRYIFQIDTTDLYNSPIMEQHVVEAPGGVVEWAPSSIYAINFNRDSVVFFWRCSLDSAGQGDYNWHEFSFQHITGKTGWGQSHFFQFKDNAFNLLNYDRPGRRIDYFGGNHQIACVVRGGSYNQVYWTKDLEMQEGNGCGATPYMNVAVVDPFDFSTWETGYGGSGHYYGEFNAGSACVDRPKKNFAFRFVYANQPDVAQMDTMAYMLSNVIPNGHYVLVYSYVRLLRNSLLASNAMNAMAALGAVNLANGTVPDSVPYIFFCKKGDPSSVQEVWGDTPEALIEMNASMTLSSRSGSLQAPRSNPALGWQGLSWQISPRQANDSTRIQLAGVSQGFETALLDLEGLTGDVDLLPIVDPDQFSQLRLKGSFWNDTVETPLPAQLKRWQLLGVPAPECAIDPPSGFLFHMDSLFQGQDGQVMVAVRNIGQVHMDSLLMTAWVTDRNNQVHRVHYKYNPPLPEGAVLRDTITINTQQYPGPNSILIEANPIDTLTGEYDQREQYHFNNIAELRFLTLQDLENPMLDITFDGIHILDGDIVSAEPEILIRLEDENQTLLLDQPGDTAYFKVFLTDPSGANRRIYFREGTREVLQFIPASGPENVSQVIYRPKFTVDGKYRISVRATDKSRNNSGDRDNSANFEVITRPTITEVLNYPNPFTTSTRFVFTVTGREPPTAMRIQVMTITGRVVREISAAELGPLHVGRNITQFAWDGTDQFGDRLARGVYLYRVTAQLHGQDIEYRDGGAGAYFTKGVGKMFLLH
ncbi:MAG: hypothetical protein J5I62_08110 [Flavobacteriales bacterium]|nr:hypothetical protein [Flavobacteriales bacterium]MEB2342917.1 C25 family cysteine peptidase [Flavobacteriia bacterium]